MVHPIAAGDMFGTKGIDHLAKTGPDFDNSRWFLSFRSVVSGAAPHLANARPTTRLLPTTFPSGILFDMIREAAGKRPGVLTKVGMDTFADPDHEGCAMNDAAREQADCQKNRV